MQRYTYTVTHREDGIAVIGGEFGVKPVPSPTDAIAASCRATAPNDGREHLIAFALDARLNVVGYSVVASGTVDAVMLYPRDVYAWALQVPTVRYVALAHNHPSGDVEPSEPDAAGTAVCAAAGQLIGLDLAWAIVFTHRSDQWREIKPPQGAKRPQPGEDQKPERPEDAAPDAAGPEGEPEDGPDEGEDDGDEAEPGDEDSDQEAAVEAAAPQDEADEAPAGGMVGNADDVSLDDVRAAMKRLLKKGGRA